MFKWLRQYRNASRHTKYFILTWLVFGLCIVATTIYCYARLVPIKKIESASTLKKRL